VGRGESGRIKVTDLGMRLAYPGTPEEGSAAKKAAFKTPELYTKLLERYAGAVVTKDGLKNILFRDYKIVESMAPLAAEAFLDSLKVAELMSAENVVFGEGAPSRVDEAPKPGATGTSSGPAPRGMKQVLVPDDFVVYKCKISRGRVIDVPLPPNLADSDVKRIHAFLQTQIDEPAEDVQKSEP